ncbi:MAG: nucleotidyltransferase domain-containing protein [Candidatus Aminicenantes bacterium]|nr:nucleotidyltransferase domain-containing protein [Candidatus Aminicenantes bacterium]
MDKAEVVEKLKVYANLVKKYFPVKMVILFGSYSRDCAREDSDIDVAVVVESLENDSFSSEIELFKLRRQIDSRIEPVLFEVDQKDPSGFFRTILETGDIIYQN